MATSPKSPRPVKGPSMPKGNDEGGKFVNRNLMPVKTAEAFVPTPSEPVRLHFKMAGGC